MTRHYLALADRRDPRDPILRQILPSPAEMEPPPPGYSDDAVGDLLPGHHPAPGLVHKYPGRALLVTTSACAVNCRFCFRRNYPYDELRRSGSRSVAALVAVASDPSIHEVILSGGDPLSLTDGALSDLVQQVAAIPHVRRLRIHTRMPVVLPQRVTPELLEILDSTRLSVWLVTHFNHPRELVREALDACHRVARAGIPVLNQSVVLRGVNDEIEVLVALCEGLVDAGIKPYYLHRLDRVRGVAHFEVPDDELARLYAELRDRVSGIALPSLVADLPGGCSKTPVLVESTGESIAAEPPNGASAEGSDLANPQTPPSRTPVRTGLALLLSVPLVLAAAAGSGCNRCNSLTPTHAPSGAVGTDLPDDGSADKPAPGPTQAVADSVPGPAPLSSADQVLAADLDGDGNDEVLVSSGNEVRWGTWPQGAPAPSLHGRMLGQGRLQTWHAADLDGDGSDEVVAAFGVGRGFADAPLELLLLDQDGPTAVVRPLWTHRGERNQVSAIKSWPRDDGTLDLYVAVFESQFVVRGGVLKRTGGEPRWLKGHRLRMGMARAVGDFDGDGQFEVAVGRLYGDDTAQDGDLRVLQEDGSVEMIPTLRGVRAVGAADTDGDGRDDVLFGDGWHKHYGKLGRYRPSVGRRAADGRWTVQLVEEQSDQYAVEAIAFEGGQLVVGGNREVRLYRHQDGSWQRTAIAGPSSPTGAFAILADGTILLGGPQVRRGTRPAATAGSESPGRTP